MNKILAAALVAMVLFVGMLVFLEFGRRLGNRRLASDPDGARGPIPIREAGEPYVEPCQHPRAEGDD